jgi:predicted membrane protein
MTVNPAESFRISPRLIIGFGILTLGVLWTLDNLDVLESEPFTRWWPVLLVVIGLVQLLDRRSNTSRGGPVVLIIVGSVLLLNRLDFIDFSVGDLIPLGIALLGAKLIWDAVVRRQAAASAVSDPDSTLHAFAMMAGVRYQNVSQQFRGGDANAIMGGVELDLTQARVAAGEAPAIETFAMWGGIEIKVPANWRVVSNVLPLMGSFEDNTRHNGEPGPTLTVRGTAIMGGIEVKN